MKSNDSLRFLLLLTCWAGLSCGDPNVLQFAADPALIVNPDFPLVVTVTFETNLPCLARVTVRDGDHSREIDFLEYRNQQHRLPILGLEPTSSYELELSILNESGDPIESRKLTHKTASLPPDFPQLHVEESQPERMEPGYTMFGVVNIPSGEGQETPPFTIVLDSAGKVVWYHRGDEGPGTPIVQLDGKFLGIMHESEIAEFTLDGSIYRRWHASQFPNNGKELEVEVHSIPVPTETLHHDLLVLPSDSWPTSFDFSCMGWLTRCSSDSAIICMEPPGRNSKSKLCVAGSSKLGRGFDKPLDASGPIFPPAFRSRPFSSSS